MTANLALKSSRDAEQFDVRLLGEDELLQISGGGPALAALAIAGMGAGAVLVGVAVGVAAYYLLERMAS